MRFFRQLSPCAALLALADPAAAARSADAAAAQALFDHGREAAQRGDWQTACDSFAESQRLDPGVGTLLNWANCEAHRGLVASAWQHFNEADSFLDPRDDRHFYVRREIRKLAEQARSRGVTIVPLKMYFANGRAKLLIGVARGRKQQDRRESLAKQQADRDIRRALSRRR